MIRTQSWAFHQGPQFYGGRSLKLLKTHRIKNMKYVFIQNHIALRHESVDAAHEQGLVRLALVEPRPGILRSVV